MIFILCHQFIMISDFPSLCTFYYLSAISDCRCVVTNWLVCHDECSVCPGLVRPVIGGAWFF